MLEYTALKGFAEIPFEQVSMMHKMYDVNKHGNLAEAIGFDIFQDARVIDESSPHDAQNYSIAVKTKSAVNHDLGHGYTGYHALIEVHCYDKETIIFTETPFDCFDLFSKLISQQEIIKNSEDS